MSWTFYVETQPHRRFRQRLHILHDLGPNGAALVARPIEFLKLEPFVAAPEDNCALADEHGVGSVKAFLQAALDAAWEQGLRPTGHQDHTNEIAAVRDHLNDMRAIAAAKLDVPLSFAVKPVAR